MDNYWTICEYKKISDYFFTFFEQNGQCQLKFCWLVLHENIISNFICSLVIQCLLVIIFNEAQNRQIQHLWASTNIWYPDSHRWQRIDAYFWQRATENGVCCVGIYRDGCFVDNSEFSVSWRFHFEMRGIETNDVVQSTEIGWWAQRQLPLADIAASRQQSWHRNLPLCKFFWKHFHSFTFSALT